MKEAGRTHTDWSKYFYYDTSPSFLRWKVSRWSGRNSVIEHIKAGQVAGCPDSKGQWQVNLAGTNTMCHRIIWELLNGPIPEGYWIDHRYGDGTLNCIENLRCVEPVINARNLKKYSNNSSGVVGVSLLVNKTGKGENLYWMAKWASLERKQMSKRFPVAKYGDEEAFRLACEYRQKMIDQLNNQGAGYTDRHGT